MSELQSPSPPANPPTPPAARRRRWPRRLIVALLVPALLVLAAPYILARAPFRNWMLGAALAELNGEVRAGGATFDWFQPIALYDLEVIPPDGPPVLVVPVVAGDKPLWRLLTDPSNLGVFRIERPQVEIVLREGGSTLRDLLAKLDKQQDPTPDDDANQVAGGATFGVDLISGSLTVRRQGSPRAWDAREIQLSARVERAQTGHERELIVAPGRVLNQIAITPEVCDDFLKFLAPTLAQVTRAGGSFSLDLDRCRVPLDRPREADVLGRLTLHDIKAGPGPMVEQVATLFGVPDANQLAREQVVQFRLSDGRAYHQDLTFTVGPMAIGTQGSVLLEDQSLEMILAVRLPEFANQAAPFRSALSGETLSLPIRGNLARPEIDRSVLRDSGLGVLSGVLDSLMQGRPVSADAIQGALRDGRLLGNGPTLPPAAPAAGSPGIDPAAAGAPAVGAVAAPAMEMLNDILRQRATRVEQRRAEEAANPAPPAAAGSPAPPADRPIRRRARQLLDTLTKPPPTGSVAPPADPPANPPPRSDAAPDI